MPAFLFLHAGSLVHYRSPFSRDPAARVAFLLKKVSTVPESAEHAVLWAFCQRCGAAGLGDRRDRHAASHLGRPRLFLALRATSLAVNHTLLARANRQSC